MGEDVSGRIRQEDDIYTWSKHTQLIADRGRHHREKEGTSMGHKTAEERFKAAAAVLRERDVEDRKDYQQRKRSKAAEAKAKKRARELEEDPGVTLGPGLGYPGEESYEGILSSEVSISLSAYNWPAPLKFVDEGPKVQQVFNELC